MRAKRRHALQAAKKAKQASMTACQERVQAKERDYAVGMVTELCRGENIEISHKHKIHGANTPYRGECSHLQAANRRILTEGQILAGATAHLDSGRVTVHHAGRDVTNKDTLLTLKQKGTDVRIRNLTK